MAKAKAFGALAQIRKDLPKLLKDEDPIVTVDPNTLTESRPHLTTGSVVLDYLIGGAPNKRGVAPCPGWPKGMVSNIFGHESSGKTTIALEAAAAVCASGGTVCFIDWENAISLDYASALGVPVEDPDSFLLVQPTTLEAGVVTLFACIRGGVTLVILDSVGAGVPKALVQQSLQDKGEMGRVGLVAAKWSTVLPQVAREANQYGTHVMGLSQLRKKINTGYGAGYGEDSTHQGGEAWKYYSAVRVSFTRIKSLKSKDYDALTHKSQERVTSALVKAKIVKTKVSNSQQRTAEFHITFGEGVDNVRDMIMAGCAHRVCTKSGAWFQFELSDGRSIKSQGMDSFKSDILATSGAMEELAAKVMTAMRSGSASIAPDEIYDEDDVVDTEFGFVTD